MTTTAERERHIQALYYLQKYLERARDPRATSQVHAIVWALAQVAALYPDDYTTALELVESRRKPKPVPTEGTTDDHHS